MFLYSLSLPGTLEWDLHNNYYQNSTWNTSKQTQPLLYVIQTDFFKRGTSFFLLILLFLEVKRCSWKCKSIPTHLNSLSYYLHSFKKIPPSYPLNFLLFWWEVHQIFYLLRNQVYLPHTKGEKVAEMKQDRNMYSHINRFIFVTAINKKGSLLKRVPAVPSLIPLLLLSTNY